MLFRSADIAYRPLYSDVTVKAGESWFYRVTARNAGGKSQPSPVVGPVRVEEICTVDEFQDLSRVAGRSQGLTLDNTYNARYAEYLFRVKGSTNDWIGYTVAGPIREVRVTAFFLAGNVSDPAIQLSADGQTFAGAPVARTEKKHIAPPHADSKRPQTQVDYVVTPQAGMRHVKISWTGPMALDRVELYHPGK